MNPFEDVTADALLAFHDARVVAGTGARYGTPSNAVDIARTASGSNGCPARKGVIGITPRQAQGGARWVSQSPTPA